MEHEQVQKDNVAILIDAIEKRPNKAVLDQAVKNEKRVRLHTVGAHDSTTSYSSFIDWVGKLLPSEKFSVFKLLLSDPTDTLAHTEQVFKELKKIFEASNPSRKLTFKTDSPTKTNEFNKFFDVPKYFRTEVFERLKTEPNSFIMVDIDEKGEPELKFICLESVVDVNITREGKVKHILYKAGKDQIIGVDETAYYVFEKDKSASSVNPSKYSVKAGYPSNHNLVDVSDKPYTPVFMLYPSMLNTKDNITVNSPITKVLGKLDWLLFWEVSKKCLDLYAPFPIYVSYEENCNYSNGSLVCTDGFLVDTASEAESPSSKVPCPKCSKTKMFGAGTEVTVPAPQSKDEPNLLDAINVIPAEEKSIEYVTKEKERLSQEIYFTVLGKTSQPLETFSQSVSQLDLSTESRKAVLIDIKEKFESVENCITYTMCKLKYGEEFKESYTNYGDNYFLLTADQASKSYKTLKDSGAPESVLHSVLETLVGVTHKTSPSTALLNLVYLEVEPYQTMSLENVTKLVGTNMIPKKKALGKIHFTDFIEEFESENASLISLIELGLEPKERVVKAIKERLNAYVEKIIAELDKDYEMTSKREMENTPDPKLAKPNSVGRRQYRQQPTAEE